MHSFLTGCKSLEFYWESAIVVYGFKMTRRVFLTYIFNNLIYDISLYLYNAFSSIESRVQ